MAHLKTRLDAYVCNGPALRQRQLIEPLAPSRGESLSSRIFASPHQKIEASSASLFLDHATSRGADTQDRPFIPCAPCSKRERLEREREVVRKVVHGWIIRVINERGNIPRRFRNYAVVSARRKKENISLQSFLPHRWLYGEWFNRSLLIG